MSSPPSTDATFDPVAELEAALRTNAFGIDSSSSGILYTSSFPVTPEDKQAVASQPRAPPQSGASRNMDKTVTAKAEVGLLEGSVAQVILDRRGFTLEHVHAVDGKVFPGTTYETLEAMLIAVSPGYVQAMGTEVGERFKGYGGESGEGVGREPSKEEIKVAEGGEGWGR